MSMSWREALKEYQKSSGKFVIPKKGSPEYEAIKKIQGVSTPEPVVKEVVKEGLKGVVKENKKKKGEGLKEVFTTAINMANNSIDKIIPQSKRSVPLYKGETHAKKIVTENVGKSNQKRIINYNYYGPNTKFTERSNKGIKGINKMDDAAKEHDRIYTLDFQTKMRQDIPVSREEVQAADDRFLDGVKKNRSEDPLLASVTTSAFAVKKGLENAGLLSHDAFFDPKTSGSGLKKTKKPYKGGGIKMI